MAVKSLSSFFKPGVTEDVNQMSFMRYEERRKLKIAMLEEYDSEKANMTYENDPMAYIKSSKSNNKQKRYNTRSISRIDNSSKRKRKMSETSKFTKFITFYRY
jgi:hypothetical protein